VAGIRADHMVETTGRPCNTVSGGVEQDRNWKGSKREKPKAREPSRSLPPISRRGKGLGRSWQKKWGGPPWNNVTKPSFQLGLWGNSGPQVRSQTVGGETGTIFSPMAK